MSNGIFKLKEMMMDELHLLMGGMLTPGNLNLLV